MKIRTKLLIGFAILMTILLLLSSAGIRNVYNLSNQINEVYDDRYMKVSFAITASSQANEIAKYIANVLTVPTQQMLDQNKGPMERAAAGLNEAVVKLKVNTNSDIENEMVNELAADNEQYQKYMAQVVDLIGSGQAQAAVRLRESKGRDIQDHLNAQILQLTNYHQRAMESAIEQAKQDNMYTTNLMITVTTVGIIAGLIVVVWGSRSLSTGFNALSVLISGFAKGGGANREARLQARPEGEFGEIADSFIALADDLDEKTAREEEHNREMQRQTWIKTNLASVIVGVQNQHSQQQLAEKFMDLVTPLVGASYGALYLRDKLGEGRKFELMGVYAGDDREAVSKQFAWGEGLVGQCAANRKPMLVEQVPDSYVRIRSGLGEANPSMLYLIPFHYQNHVVAVLELATLKSFTSAHIELLEQLSEDMGMVVNNMFGRIRIEELLRESQTMSEELQSQSEELMSQQEELRRSNERLEEQTRALKRSEETLQSQQEELEQTNEELLQKTHLLELQMKEAKKQKEQIEKTRDALEKQTVQLGLASKYKSEFLANMSHELRTPLNSLLILSQMLADNKEGNLTEKQVEFATTIHASGSDLLKLIDEILDLSKIGAGKMDLVTEQVLFEELGEYLKRHFTPISEQKKIAFRTEVDPGLPGEIFTDGHRVKQILRNLLSNAFKFTNQGSVTLRIRAAGEHELPADGIVKDWIAFEVSDTGIGIPKDKQAIIFEAFQQADGTTSRKYGGTGLGLAISRDLAQLLGGTLRLKSEAGRGSTFTLVLPAYHAGSELQPEEAGGLTDPRLYPQLAETAASAGEEEAAKPEAPSGTPTEHPADFLDDLEELEPGDKVVLIIEDDPAFARILLDIARSRGFKGIVAMQGDKGLSYARNYKPDAILLDIQLPVMDGWSVLHQLKNSSDTRHIPVHLISVIDEIQQGLSLGAIAYLKKPTSKENLDAVFSQIEAFMERNLKRLLIVEDDSAQRRSIEELIGDEDVAIMGVSTGREALQELSAQRYDCMVLDLGLPDMSGFELLDQIRRNEDLHDMPIIIYTGRELEKREEMMLKKYAETIIIKDVKSPERLLDETTLFLHRIEAQMPEEKRNLLRKLHNVETIFEHKNVLIVDDDIRNVFALSNVLESYNMNILYAENGREAIETMDKNPDLDLVLMDIMMPEMDGYEAMRLIRSNPKFDQLPIIAITAKAMKSDRDKCIEAGASDYIAKPVNIDQLLSLMRVWLYK